MTENAHKSIKRQISGYLRQEGVRVGKGGVSQVYKETLRIMYMFTIFSVVMSSYM